MNLHDWIDELMDALDIEAELDEALILDVARQAAHRVQRPAAPISTFLLGYAAALAGGGVEETEALAARALDLAARWEGGEAEVPDVEVERERRPRQARPGRRRLSTFSTRTRPLLRGDRRGATDQDSARPPSAPPGRQHQAVASLAPCAPSSPPSPVAPKS